MLLTVDPTRVERKTEQSCWYWQHEYAGEVWGGSWDRETHPLDSDAKFVALKHRFQDGAAWEETELYAALRTEGVSHETIVEHLEKYDRLYENIRERYRTSFELPHAEFLEEICISIGRNGELYSCDSGLHRLAIAQTIDLNEVPVRVMLRHEQWQRTREQFHEHWSEDTPLPDHLREYEDHADLADLRRSHVVGYRG